jgi:hypothetical protein
MPAEVSGREHRRLIVALELSLLVKGALVDLIFGIAKRQLALLPSTGPVQKITQNSGRLSLLREATAKKYQEPR